jgi:aerobic carbon-monoxide dehydrogenase medium subunit
MKPVNFDFSRPESIANANESLSTQAVETKLLAGGQTLGPMLNLRLARPGHLLDISRIDELRQSSESSDFVRFGAAITHSEIEDGLHPDPLAGHMRNVAGKIAYRVVRNRGTIGGSIAHADPAADWVNFLTACDATVLMRNARGERALPMTEFVCAAYTTALADDELIVAVLVPKYAADIRFGYYKQCRKVGEFADAAGVVVIAPSKKYCRVVAGAIGAKPCVLQRTAATLASSAEVPSIAEIREDISAQMPQLDPVKVQMGAASVQRAIASAVRP